ncbi:MAG TPA: hypothetical protein VJJ23_00715 [Candidatus Nanoarchaeia archaeon]|nr:hypothetical protein [Candidatus Nanoarchaeia archaeon]
MATIGNLELRIGNETLYGSSTHDGYNVYKVINMLATFLNKKSHPTAVEYKQWFRRTARELLPFRHSELLIGGVPSEVVIDVNRKLIFYNANEEENEMISIGAIGRLWGRHKYQTWRYIKRQ